MKVYRASRTNEDMANDGFEWFTDKRKAQQAQKEFDKQADANEHWEQRPIQDYEIQLNKNDIIKF